MKPPDGWFLAGFIAGSIVVHLTVENAQVPFLSAHRDATFVAMAIAGVGLGGLLRSLHVSGVLPPERSDPWEDR